MFHKAKEVKFNNGVTIEVAFTDGKVFRYDMSQLFTKYPQLKALQDRGLFESGKLDSPFGISWNEELDLETETIYQDGILVGQDSIPLKENVGAEVYNCRGECNISQKQLSSITGIEQADISRIENGLANPSVDTIERIAKALNKKAKIVFY